LTEKETEEDVDEIRDRLRLNKIHVAHTWYYCSIIHMVKWSAEFVDHNIEVSGPTMSSWIRMNVSVKSIDATQP